MTEETLIEHLAQRDHARAVAVVDANALGRIPVYTPDGPVLLVANWEEQQGKEEFRATGRMVLEELGRLGLHPLRVPSVSMQELCDAGFNCFAVKLLVESFRRFPDHHAQGIAFEIGGVRVALTPAAERQTEIEDSVTLRLAVTPPAGEGVGNA